MTMGHWTHNNNARWHNTAGNMKIELKVIPRGCHGKIHVLTGSYTDGEEICTIGFDRSSTILHGTSKAVTGRHSIFFVAEAGYNGWAQDNRRKPASLLSKRQAGWFCNMQQSMFYVFNLLLF